MTLKLIKEQFSEFFESESDIKVFETTNGAGCRYFIKSKENLLICISYDYKENELDLFVKKEFIDFDSLPLNLLLMDNPRKNKHYKNSIDKIRGKNLIKNIERINIMKDYIKSYLNS